MQSRIRLFPAGSRQAPDPYDQFLEQRGFYRKHTARDASSLFRVLSEQLFDTQLHHEKVRKDLVNYMQKKRNEYKDSIDGDFDEYLKNLSKANGVGSLIELRAAGNLYQRNVIIFGAFNTGVDFVRNENYKEKFRVFFTPENHFDSIFLDDYISDLAFTQSLCFELLYKKVFCLPDVMYSVERMLHDPLGETMKYVCTNPKKSELGIPDLVVVDDGRHFVLDRPENTSCILDNYELCHFHNKNFAKFVEGLQREAQQCENTIDQIRFNKTLESLLPDKDLSCVRQLMKEGITPFPYKVAKGLDPDIYRNIEFDAWSDLRKIRKNKMHNGFVVGQKCFLRMEDESKWYNCHIQEISSDREPCLVFIEELCEKRYVNIDQLKINERYKRWNTGTRFIRKPISYRKCNINPQGYRRYKEYSPRYIEDSYDYAKDIDPCENEKCLSMTQYTDLHHFTPSTKYEVIAMPLQKESTFNNCKKVSEINNNNNNVNHNKQKKNNDRNNVKSSSTKDDSSTHSNDKHLVNAKSANGGVLANEKFNPHSTPATYHDEHYSVPESDMSFYEQTLPFPYDPNIPPPVPYTYPQGMLTANQLQQSMYFYPSNPIYQQPGSSNQSFSSVPGTTYSGNMSSSMYMMNPCMPFLIPIRRKDIFVSRNPVNYQLNHSYNPNGSDIPIGDMPSVRFFYNLGIEYFRFIHSQYGNYAIEYLSTQQDNMTVSQDMVGTPSSNDNEVKHLYTDIQNNLKLDDTPTSTNVATSHQHGHKNNAISIGKTSETQNSNSSHQWKRRGGGTGYQGHQGRKDNHKGNGGYRNYNYNKNSGVKPTNTQKKDETTTVQLPQASQSLESNVTGEISVDSSERSDIQPVDYYQYQVMPPMQQYAGGAFYIPYCTSDPIEPYTTVYPQPYFAPSYGYPAAIQPQTMIQPNDAAAMMIPCDSYSGVESPPLHYQAYPSYVYQQPYTTPAANQPTVPNAATSRAPNYSYWCYPSIPIVPSPLPYATPPQTHPGSNNAQ